MTKKTLSDSEPKVGFLKYIVKFWFIIFLFTVPMMFVIGLPGIYTGGWPVWVGIVVSITGLITLILVITYSVIKEMKKRKEDERFITKTNLAVISFVGLCEIIISIPLIFIRGIDFAVGFLFLGGGSITFFPAVIYLVIIIFKERFKKPTKVTSIKISFKPLKGNFANKIPSLFKISGGFFILLAILDTINYFNESFAFVFTNLVLNMLNLIFLTIICFMVKTNDETTVLFARIVGSLLIVYVILWSGYNFMPVIDFYADGFVFIGIHLFRAVAFFLFIGVMTELAHDKGSAFYVFYGANYLVSMIVLLISFNTIIFIALITSWAMYWVDTAFLFIMGMFLIRDAGRIARPISTTSKSSFSSKYYTRHNIQE